MAIPGGRSPVPVFRWLAQHLPAEVASRTTVTWVDERHLPFDPDSSWVDFPDQLNLRGAFEHWFEPARVAPAYLPLSAPGTVAEAASTVAARFDDELGGLDVVLLGAGPDGHIASWFPGRSIDVDASVVAVQNSPKPPPERLTLTERVLREVRCAVLVASGADRADMLARAYAGDPTLPLGSYRPEGAWHWVLDPAASAALPPESQ